MIILCRWQSCSSAVDIMSAVLFLPTVYYAAYIYYVANSLEVGKDIMIILCRWQSCSTDVKIMYVSCVAVTYIMPHINIMLQIQ